MNLKRLVPISLIALLLSMILPIANAEQLKRYKVVNVDGVVITIAEGYPSYYTGRVTWWVSTNNTVAAAAEGSVSALLILDSFIASLEFKILNSRL